MQRLIPLVLFAALPLSAATAGNRYIVSVAETRYAAAVGPRALASSVLGDAASIARHQARELPIINAFAANLSADEISALKKSPDVVSIDPVVERHLLDNGSRTIAPLASAGSPYLHRQAVPYGIDLVHAREVWPVSQGQNVNVAILDTGVTYDHPDLAKNIAGGWNVITGSSDFHDDHGHGTHVAGTIAAMDNDFGVVGVAPQTHIWAVKVLGADGNGDNEDIILGVDWVVSKKKEIGGNWIVSMSFGSGETSPPERAAFERLQQAGVLPVAAAGNSGFWQLDYPAAYPWVLSVGAVDSAKQGAWFTSGGGTLGVMAPGVDVLSTVPTGSAHQATTDAAGLHINGLPFIQSSRAEITAPVVFCGYGGPGSCESDPTGKIAVMQRGFYYYAEKVRNVMAEGAIAAVVYNNYEITMVGSLVRPDCDANNQNCHDNADDLAFNWPIVVAVPLTDGQKLAHASGLVTIKTWDDDYGLKSGTSMAAPHVAGVAALLWSLAPTAQAIDIRRVIELTANDLAERGFDPGTGNGLVNALAAAKALAPGAFGLPPAPLPSPAKRRSASH